MAIAMLSLVELLAGLAILTIGAGLLVRGAVAIAERLHVPHLIVGLTVVAFGTSAPELVVSLGAALEGSGGNAIGSNIVNILAIMGLTAAVVPVAVPPDFFFFEIWAMIAAALLLAPFVVLAIPIGRVAGTLMTVAYAAVVAAALGGASAKAIDRDGSGRGLFRAELPL